MRFLGLRSDSLSRQSSAGRRFWLEYNGRLIELSEGRMTFGRSMSNDLVLDDPLVSRCHAQLTVTDGLLLEDLSSVNGVFVNGDRITRPNRLKDGDRITIGKQDMLVRSLQPGTATSPLPCDEGAVSRDRNPLASTQRMSSGEHALSSDLQSENTLGGDALELLGGVADKVLALGRGVEAEKLLSKCLSNVLDRARRGEIPAQATLDQAARFAVRLAEANAKPSWIDYAIELFTLAARPLPSPVVDHLHHVARRVSGVSRPGLREYLAVLKKHQAEFGPAERFLVQRLEGLEQIVK